MKRFLLPFAALTFLSAGPVPATGVMIPKGLNLPPLAIKYQRVQASISNLVAQTTVKQAFQNSTDRQLEATYLFPLPPGASITEFSMMINGKKMVGELVEKQKARKIYQDIVRRMKDPGLLEYMGSNLFKASVFPIPPRGVQEVEMRYSEVVRKDSGICSYVYPLRTDERASRTLEDFTVAVKLESKEPIKAVYSHTHKIDVVKRSDHEATAGFEAMGQPLDRDFRLFWTVSDKDFGVNLLARREQGTDGFFMLMVSPKTEFKKEEIIKKDMVFVIDTSGSMGNNNKIQQARQALGYCVLNLNPGDRFNVVRFSTDVETFGDQLVEATKDNLDKAQKFIGDFVARGGTDINGALEAALALKTDKKRPFTVVFLTDGLPTIGTTDPKQILGNVEKTADQVRVFCFGVGYDVNTHLLDQVSGSTKGASEYVKPEEDIEVKVSLFHNKASEPVLANLSLDFGDIKTFDMYPKKLPDLFRGTQLLVLGRYKNPAHTAIRLKGEVNGAPKEFVYEESFPEVSAENDFVERLWATRKVGYLLDEIRLHGENKELKDEVLRLSKEYGIMTPYTSYLVLEDDAAYSSRRISRREEARRLGDLPRRPGSGEPKKAGHKRPAATGVDDLAARGGEGGGKSRSQPSDSKGPASSTATSEKQEAEYDGGEGRDGDSAAPSPEEEPAAEDREDAIHSYLARKDGPPKTKPHGDRALQGSASGKDAVDLSEKLMKLKKAEATMPTGSARERAAMKSVGKKMFYRVADVWVDRDYSKESEVTKVKYASDAYFLLIEKIPELKKFFALGDRVIVVLKSGKAIQVADEGKEKLTEEEIAELLK